MKETETAVEVDKRRRKQGEDTDEKYESEVRCCHDSRLIQVAREEDK